MDCFVAVATRNDEQGKVHWIASSLSRLAMTEQGKVYWITSSLSRLAIIYHRLRRW